jgi:putative endonuclease
MIAGMDFYYTYVLESTKDGKRYTGYTRDLQSRFEKHQAGKVNSTKHRRPFKLIYFEACLRKEDAIRREKYLKTHYGSMFIKKRLKSYFTGQVRQ